MSNQSVDMYQYSILVGLNFARVPSPPPAAAALVDSPWDAPGLTLPGEWVDDLLLDSLLAFRKPLVLSDRHTVERSVERRCERASERE